MLLQCQICQDSFTLDHFRFYNCGHGFCRTCTNQMSFRNTSSAHITSMSCPICRCPIPVNERPHQIFVTYQGRNTQEVGVVGPNDMFARLDDQPIILDASNAAAFAKDITDTLTATLVPRLQDIVQSELARFTTNMKQMIEKTLSDADDLRQRVQQVEHDRSVVTKKARAANERLEKETEENVRLRETIQRQRRAIEKKDEELRLMQTKLEEKEKARRALKLKLDVLNKQAKPVRRNQTPDDSLRIV